jgi:hypothetical protein
MWASLFYSCCMSKPELPGQVRLEGDDSEIALGQDDTANDEQIARRLQAQDGNWQV